jgi:hypothetical protein
LQVLIEYRKPIAEGYIRRGTRPAKRLRFEEFRWNSADPIDKGQIPDTYTLVEYELVRLGEMAQEVRRRPTGLRLVRRVAVVTDPMWGFVLLAGSHIYVSVDPNRREFASGTIGGLVTNTTPEYAFDTTLVDSQ